MKLVTTRFGELLVRDEQILFFPRGVLSAPQRSHFVIVDDPATAPFQWLVCIERPACMLSVLDPALVLTDDSAVVVQQGDTTTFVVATPGDGTVAWWLDLRHPILIAATKHTGEQVTLDDASLPERFPVEYQQSHGTGE